MILLDTTVLLYAVGGDHPCREPSRALVRAVGDGSLMATTTPEVIQEFAHVRARRRGRTDALALARHYVDLLEPLVTVGTERMLVGLTLWETRADLGAFDSVLAAVALDSRDGSVVSADRAFSTVPGVRHVLPDGVGVTRLLR